MHVNQSISWEDTIRGLGVRFDVVINAFNAHATGKVMNIVYISVQLNTQLDAYYNCFCYNYLTKISIEACTFLFI